MRKILYDQIRRQPINNDIDFSGQKLDVRIMTNDHGKYVPVLDACKQTAIKFLAQFEIALVTKFGKQLFNERVKPLEHGNCRAMMSSDSSSANF